MLGPLPDEARSTLRAAVAEVHSALVHRAGASDAEEAQSRVEAHWRKLVDLLALGPEPEYGECRSCGHVGIRAAKRCGWCWAETHALPAPDRGGAR